MSEILNIRVNPQITASVIALFTFVGLRLNRATIALVGSTATITGNRKIF